MASIGNLYAFGDWFSKPPSPLPPLNLLSLINPKPFHSRLKFCSISASSSSDRTQTPSPESTSPPPGYYDQMLSQYFWECQNLPDYRHTPQVEEILKRDAPLTPEEKKQVDANLRELRSTSPMIKFLARAEEIADDINSMQLKANELPYHSEDAELWRKVPHVEGLDGRPMVRKAIKTKKESDDKFWDFTKQFLFGLWGFRQRPYPSSRPIDVAQAIGYKRLEKRYYDFIMRSGGWYYKDRLGRTRGPLELITLKTAWGAGIIDKDTFIWGEDMDEWAPIHMVYGMERAIATWEVRFGAAATEFIHKLQKGIPPWVPLKGREKKTFKQLQDEAVQSKKRDLAVLEANDGVWPGVRTPSHALFLWASGSELTSILEADHMPNKYIPKDLRKQLQKAIPGLRPWEVLSVEQAMDQITYGGQWYREPLGSYTTGPPYIEEWNRNILKVLRGFYKLNRIAYDYMQATLPGFGALMEMTEAQVWEKLRKQKEKELAEEKEELKKILAQRLKKGP